ncbi:MAG: hypothetical protein N3E47_05630 [Candidatus Bathyarchaeota archaeon]|nr:hypothetical protein [Candidatus Bathyarchaeota archaeon]
MVKNLFYRIDLTKIEGEGEFPCPSCGNIISPEDESNLNYEIIDVKTDSQGRLKELLIICKRCGSKIYLEGFELLDELENLKESEGIEEETEGSPI